MLIFALFSHSYQSLLHLSCHPLQFKRCVVQSLLPARPPYYSYLRLPPAPKAATTEAPEATAQHHHLSRAPMPIYSACLSSPPIQALKCLVKFTEAHHLLDWSSGRGPMSKFSLSHLIKSRGTRREYKESSGMIYNAIVGRVGRKMSSY